MGFFEALFNNLSFGQTVILFSMFIIPIGVLLALFGIKSGIKLGRNFQIGGIKNTGVSAQDLVLIINETADICIKKSEIQFKELLRSQMNYAEQRLIHLKGLKQSIYLTLLSNHLEDKSEKNNVTSHKDYQYYSILLSTSTQDTLDILRSAFKENNFECLAISDFELYIKNKVDLIEQRNTDLLNVTHNNMTVTRVELYEANKSAYHKFLECYKDIFYKSIDIYKRKHAEMDKLDKELENFIELITNKNKNKRGK